MNGAGFAPSPALRVNLCGELRQLRPFLPEVEDWDRSQVELPAAVCVPLQLLGFVYLCETEPNGQQVPMSAEPRCATGALYYDQRWQIEEDALDDGR